MISPLNLGQNKSKIWGSFYTFLREGKINMYQREYEYFFIKKYYQNFKGNF